MMVQDRRCFVALSRLTSEGGVAKCTSEPRQCLEITWSTHARTDTCFCLSFPFSSVFCFSLFALRISSATFPINLAAAMTKRRAADADMLTAIPDDELSDIVRTSARPPPSKTSLKNDDAPDFVVAVLQGRGQ